MRTGNRFGDLGGTTLTSILQAADRGDIEEYVDLCQFAISTDEHLAALYSSRIDRICEQRFEIVPNPYGDQGLATKAAELVKEALARIENWDHAIRAIAHAVAPGFSANEMEWAYDEKTRMQYVRRVHHRHGHRFRFGPHWKLRLYDRGMRGGADSYGEMLQEDLFIVHVHQEQAGYPTIGGVMRATLWKWMFKRWVEKMRIQSIEKHGGPGLVATVAENTPLATIEALQAQLDSLTAEHAGVISIPTTLTPVNLSGGGTEAPHGKYIDDANKAMSRLWAGTDDSQSSNDVGAQNAVAERVDANTDPKTRSDCKSLDQTLHLSLFKWLVRYNSHLIGAAPDDIPVPIAKAVEGAGEQAAATEEIDIDMDAPVDPEVAEALSAIKLARETLRKKVAAAGEPRRSNTGPRRSATSSSTLASRISKALQNA
jgi:phage gp29-like protein